MSTEANFKFTILISVLALVVGCQTKPAKPKNQALKAGDNKVFLKFYEDEIELSREKKQFTHGRSQIWTQFLENSSDSKDLLKTRKDFFLLFFKDEAEPYTNKLYKYSSCLVDSKQTDRVIFYYGDINYPTNCLKQDYRTVAVRVWKKCADGLYEVTLGPIDITENIEIVCSK